MNPLSSMSRELCNSGSNGTMFEQKSTDNDLLEEKKLFSVNNEVEGLFKEFNGEKTI